MDINEALAALDVANDEQWTTDGLPKVDVVAGLVGNDKLKRADILEASPDFNRDVAKAAAEPNPTDKVAPAQPPVEGAKPVGDQPPDYGNDAKEVTDVETRDETAPEKQKAEAKVEEQPKSLLDQLQDAFNEANQELNGISKALNVLTEQRRDLETKIGYLGGQLDRAKKATGAEQNAIQEYLKTNNRIKQEKAAVRQKLIDSGLTEVLKAVGPTAIDAAMKQRKPLPSNVRREYPRAINKD